MSELNPSPQTQCYAMPEVAAWCSHILGRAGVPKQAADVTAAILVRTDARGFRTHGLMRLRSYLEKLGSGEVSPAAEFKTDINGSYGVA